MRQIVLATFDQAIHTVAEADTAAVLTAIQNEKMDIETTPGDGSRRPHLLICCIPLRSVLNASMRGGGTV